MAATDKPYRNQQTLNVVFAVSCVAMLLTVLWMLVDDYNREFKTVQRKFRDVEAQHSLALMLRNMPDTDKVKTASKALGRLSAEEASQGRAYLYRLALPPAEFLQRSSEEQVDDLVARFGDIALAAFAGRLNTLTPAQRRRLGRSAKP